jgi:two-component system alkaline phosphatase synthesis response regulator PhoP
VPLILIVDENADACEIYLGSLGQEGFRCLQAPDAEAVEIAATELPALIIMDVLITPSNDEPLQRFKTDHRTRDIPILVVSSHALNLHRNSAMRAGADGFLTKPVLAAELVTQIRSLLHSSARRQSEQEEEGH